MREPKGKLRGSYMFTSVFMFTDGALVAYGCNCGACCVDPDPAPDPETDV